MTPLHRVLQALSIAGLVAFLLVRVEKIAEVDGSKTERLTVGLPFSPWVISERIDRPGGFKIHREVALLSWSWLCLVPAFVISYRLGRSGERSQPLDRRDQAGAPQADLRDPG